jgi:hypothetical protein
MIVQIIVAAKLFRLKCFSSCVCISHVSISGGSLVRRNCLEVAFFTDQQWIPLLGLLFFQSCWYFLSVVCRYFHIFSSTLYSHTLSLLALRFSHQTESLVASISLWRRCNTANSLIINSLERKENAQYLNLEFFGHGIWNIMSLKIHFAWKYLWFMLDFWEVSEFLSQFMGSLWSKAGFQ